MTEETQEKLEAAEKVVKADQEKRIRRQISHELNLPDSKVKAAVDLMDEGNTVPFIARYRKEMTGELDEEQLREIAERLQYIRQLEDRKLEVIRLIDEQGKLEDSLQEAIIQATKLQEVEDLYRPYRQKRKTRASVAKERGLEPLAEWIRSQPKSGRLLEEAEAYINEEKGVTTAEEAVQGAKDILAEQISDDASVRTWVRRFTFEEGTIQTEAKDSDVESVYEMYYDYKEPVRKLPPHRTLAINRGEREDILKVKVEVSEQRIQEELEKRFITGPSIVLATMKDIIKDAYQRLISPSIEREVRSQLTDKAEEHAIDIFAENLRNLLLQPPVRGNVVLGVDPAYRTGCKLAVVDDIGKVLDIAVIFPTPPVNKVAEAEYTVQELIKKHHVRLIVIGNGTASRETEQFIADLIAKLPEHKLQYLIVNEAGASVYSASKIAKEEFPEFDVSERSAVSIARRLQDPLAELVKIDPKSIGVGQYQHDVAQKRLGESLQGVVESVVNHVGVDLNTASPSLLAYISGITSSTAKNIVKYRESEGKFTNRKQLLKVPRLGAKAFEQCAGFLRITEGDNPLDNTPIHPESYGAVQVLFQKIELSENDLGSDVLYNRLQEQQADVLAPQLKLGVPTLNDIMASLQRPGRDPRDELPPPIFHTDVLKMEDLVAGMELQGTVRNVIDFGAFVDIGVKQDGLVHISQLSDKYVRHPMDVVSIGDTVTVWVMEVDVKRGRISLTMKPQ